MVLKCNVKGCRRNSSHDSEHSFFRLPTDVETRQKWLKFVDKENNCTHIRICTDHFDPQLIRKKYPRPLLVRNAVPTIRKSPEKNSRIKVCNDRFADDTNTTAQSPEKIQSYGNSPEKIQSNGNSPEKIQSNGNSHQKTQIINVHSKNLSQIIISDEIVDIDAVSASTSYDKQPFSTNATTSYNATSQIRDSTPRLDKAPIRHQSMPNRSKPKRLILTPKTMRLTSQKRTIAALRSKIIRLKSERTKKTGLDRIENLIKDSARYLPTHAHILLSTQLRLAKGNKLGNCYDKTLKDIALSIYHHSPEAYKFLAKILTLPSEKVLDEYQQQFAVYPGINIAVLAQLKDKFQRVQLKDKVVALLFDEILLTSEAHTGNNESVGLADDRNSREPVTAKTALVCMITCINKNVKQVVGHWLLPAKGESNETHDIILDAINKVNDTGLIVKAIVFDQGPKNQEFLRKVNVSVTKPFFKMNGHNIHVIWDPPHLLKSIRNNLKERILFYKGGTVEWSRIKTIYELSKQTNLNLIPKISDKHFNLNSHSKMRVSTAAQLLSASMFTAYLVYTTMLPQKFCQKSCGISCKCLEHDTTGQFISDIDKLFDSLNSSLLRSTVPNKLNYAIAEDTQHDAFLRDMATNLLNSKFTTGTRPPCLTGLVLTINSTLLLAKELRENYGISTLRTRRLNQDLLKNLFAVIRQQHGCNVNPTPKQFEAGIRHTYIAHLTQVSNISNCGTDRNKIFAQLSKITTHIAASNTE